MAILDEIKWPTPDQRRELSTRITQFLGCIGMIDGTLVKIRRPFVDTQHARWFNDRKKMYVMNNTIMVDHNGLFIHVDLGIPWELP